MSRPLFFSFSFSFFLSFFPPSSCALKPEFFWLPLFLASRCDSGFHGQIQALLLYCFEKTNALQPPSPNHALYSTLSADTSALHTVWCAACVMNLCAKHQLVPGWEQAMQCRIPGFPPANSCFTC